MTLTMSIRGRTFRVLMEDPLDLSIPMNFYGPQPNSYGVPAASSAAYSGAGFTGDTRRGGSCNFETVSLTPHCNGTHTECIGHITQERIAISNVLRDAFVPAAVVSVPTTAAGETNEHYPVHLEAHDRLVTAAALRQALDRVDESFMEALVIRTLPNDTGKRDRQYADEPASFFSEDAMKEISNLPVRHLLVDIPSLDRAYDDGKLAVHRLFWHVAPGEQAITEQSARLRTVTEFIFVPDTVRDGTYLLNLQIAPFVLDAAPSRPLLFALEEVQA